MAKQFKNLLRRINNSAPNAGNFATATFDVAYRTDWKDNYVTIKKENELFTKNMATS